MNPNRSHCPEWKVKTDYGNTTRKCVTYEDPTSPTPESNLYTDRIISDFDNESRESAKFAANKDAKPDTAKWWEIYLSILLKNKINVNRIITGIGSD